MSITAKIKRWFKAHWDEGVVYLMTLLSVIVAPYLVMMASGAEFTITLNWWGVLVGAVIAVYVVVKNESRGAKADDDAETKAKKRKAKKANLGTRVQVCMGNGFVWPSIVGVAFQVAGAGLKALGL